MRRSFLLVPTVPGPRLRTIRRSDLDDLRNWKNRDRRFFFFQGIISPEQQEEWFREYSARPDDTMFMVEGVPPAGPAFGCMGLRRLEERLDVYNVMRGRPGPERMDDAMALLCSHACSYDLPITLRVLRDNPAVSWYERCGFVRTEERPDHFLMQLERARFTRRPFALLETHP